MNSIIKKYLPYFLIVASCAWAFFAANSSLHKKMVEKEISYHADSASEAYIVWGINYLRMPPKAYWPSNSFEKDSLVYTKLPKTGNTYTITFRLPYKSILNYWMLISRDNNGNAIQIWDGGGEEKTYFTVYFNDEGYIKPGYFIFLAGFLPLLLHYLRKKDANPGPRTTEQLTISEYIPQLDSIRAIAVILVIIYHWAPENSILNFLPNGPIGVNIFFVLSGFLITGILLKSKNQAEEQGLKKGKLFINFYTRRTLRIFPIYYLLLILLWVLKDPVIQKDGVYYFTYTSNYLFYSQQVFPGRFAHLWSLGVEEQFYLLWPWVIVLAGKKILPYLIAMFWVIGVSSNFIFTSHGRWAEILTPTCFDAFATGGFLSWLISYRPGFIMKLRPAYLAISLAVFILFILDVFELSFLPPRTTHSLLAIIIIYYCLFKNNNIAANYVLNNKWLIRMGKISYGIYLYHLFIPGLWLIINKKLNLLGIDFLYNNSVPEKIKPAWLFIQELFILILAASLSWKFIEKPINRLKNKFAHKPV